MKRRLLVVWVVFTSTTASLAGEPQTIEINNKVQEYIVEAGERFYRIHTTIKRLSDGAQQRWGRYDVTFLDLNKAQKLLNQVEKFQQYIFETLGSDYLSKINISKTSAKLSIYNLYKVDPSPQIVFEWDKQPTVEEAIDAASVFIEKLGDIYKQVKEKTNNLFLVSVERGGEFFFVQFYIIIDENNRFPIYEPHPTYFPTLEDVSEWVYRRVDSQFIPFVESKRRNRNLAELFLKKRCFDIKYDNIERIYACMGLEKYFPNAVLTRFELREIDKEIPKLIEQYQRELDGDVKNKTLDLLLILWKIIYNSEEKAGIQIAVQFLNNDLSKIREFAILHLDACDFIKNIPEEAYEELTTALQKCSEAHDLQVIYQRTASNIIEVRMKK